MRKIELVNAYNMREFGGALSNGCSIHANLLFRSDNTAYLNQNEIEILRNLGIKTVIDIRSEKEKNEEKDIMSAVNGIAYYSYNFDCNDFAYYLSRNPDCLTVSLEEGYVMLLEEKETIRQIIECISDSLIKGGVVFHCSGGKDRTGLISMLVQSILGVDKNAILSDYHDTYENLMRSPVIQQWTKKFGTKYVECSPALMDSAMKYLIHKYGSIQQYLISCNISQESIVRICEILIGEIKNE